jgi:glycosyltransferase involved in cell wall biosynthesis
LANTWIEKGWEVVVFTMDAPGAEPFYPLHPSVQVHNLNLLQSSGSRLSAITNNVGRLRKLRRAIVEAEPDALISFIDQANVLALLATRGLGIPVIVSERTDPSRRSIDPFWHRLRRWTYPRADCIVFQSQGVADWFPRAISARGMVIPNPVNPPPPAPDSLSRSDGDLRIVALGRLHAVKGFDVLLRAFAAMRDRVPGCRLEIWGEGLEDESLARLARDLELGDRVRFPGVTSQPFDVLRASDLFVLSSHAEGFPNALVEAMSCGLPVISTRFGGSADDIIQDGVNGLLVPPGNAPALAEAMVRLLTNPQERSRLAERAPEVIQRFGKERIIGLWEQAINRAMTGVRTGPSDLPGPNLDGIVRPDGPHE